MRAKSPIYIHEKGAKALGNDWPESDRFTPPHTSPTKNVVP